VSADAILTTRSTSVARHVLERLSPSNTNSDWLDNTNPDPPPLSERSRQASSLSRSVAAGMPPQNAEASRVSLLATVVYPPTFPDTIAPPSRPPPVSVSVVIPPRAAGNRLSSRYDDISKRALLNTLHGETKLRINPISAARESRPMDLLPSPPQAPLATSEEREGDIPVLSLDRKACPRLFGAPRGDAIPVFQTDGSFLQWSEPATAPMRTPRETTSATAPMRTPRETVSISPAQIATEHPILSLLGEEEEEKERRVAPTLSPVDLLDRTLQHRSRLSAAEVRTSLRVLRSALGALEQLG
jgi:hypothetical protein